MRSTITMMIAAAVLATAVFSSSATAAPLDAVNTTAPEVVADTTNSSSTTTGERKIASGCGKMWSRNWSDFKYACEWDHSTAFDRSYNRFFKSYSGEVVMECECDTGLEVYRPWGAHWKYSMAEWGKIRCYSRDDQQAMGVMHEFDAYTCYPNK